MLTINDIQTHRQKHTFKHVKTRALVRLKTLIIATCDKHLNLSNSNRKNREKLTNMLPNNKNSFKGTIKFTAKMN